MTAAVILAVLTIPAHTLVLRRRPADLGLLPDGDAAPPETVGVRPAPQSGELDGRSLSAENGSLGAPGARDRSEDGGHISREV